MLIRVEAIGINPVDVFTRQNTYFGTFPEILGVDFAGTIEKVGKNASNFKIGDRIAGTSACLSAAVGRIAVSSTVVVLRSQLY